MKTIAVAMSGGVDSLAAAALVKDAGNPVFGVHFSTGFEKSPFDEERSPLALAASRLGISIKKIRLDQDFESLVVAPFVSSYSQGKTPNPCVGCNAQIKFGALLEKARQMGADSLATGHYARVEDLSGRQVLQKGLDPEKDQSYFLARLTPGQLSRAVFPLGEKTKSQARQIVAKKGLARLVLEDSQEICFIPQGRYGDFLLARPGFQARPGPITDVSGNVLGEHRGLYAFTVGQRRGINIPAAQPYYVVRLDTENNRLVVGRQKDLFSDTARIVDINWIMPVPEKPFRAMVKVRYRSPEVAAIISPETESSAEVRFETPLKAVTPGQGAVFYEGPKVLGGGWIA